jgi:hypothetical protein
MASPPVIEWRQVAGPNAVITSQAFSGTGFSGAIPAGTTSTSVQVRVYNNFANAATIADATNAVISCYDDTIHQGAATFVPTTGKYVQVEVIDYNGTTTGQDTVYFAIGGITKHAVPVNSGTLAGAAANYITVNIQIVVPANATQGAVSQGIWLEYSSTA